jgi:phage recombination protein Bet
VFNKKTPEKRRMAVVTGIDGLRALAARSGRYRPDETEPEITYLPELKGATNPLGVEKAVVRIFMRDEGGTEWRPVAGVAHWDEFAPLSEAWAEDRETGRRRPTGERILDAAGAWARMGRVMIAKCAEAQALRKAFPEDLSGLYADSELDQAHAADVSATERIEAAAAQDRLEISARPGRSSFSSAPLRRCSRSRSARSPTGCWRPTAASTSTRRAGSRAPTARRCRSSGRGPRPTRCS